MLIEYKIKLQSDGLTITQRIEQGSSEAQVKEGAPVVQNSLPGSIQEIEAANAAASQRGGSPLDQNPGGGPADSGASPITIIGPIILTLPPHSATASDASEKTKS